MKLSSKGRYGVQALFHLAFHGGDEAIQLREIAEQQAVPLRFLEQIFRDLKLAGIVSSRRGPKGGYELAAAPEAIRLGDVVRALDGPVTLCAGKSARDRSTSAIVTEAVFAELSASLQDCFDRITLRDLCDRATTLGLGKPVAAAYNYAI